MRLSAALLLFLLLLGCERPKEYVSVDANLTLSSDTAKALSKRHLEYWELRSKHTYEESYDYELPYQRFIYSLQWYRDFHSGRKKHYRIVQQEIILDDNESARIVTYFDHNGSSVTSKDRWYYINNQWYHYFIDTMLPQ